jgi:hypothetical protein
MTHILRTTAKRWVISLCEVIFFALFVFAYCFAPSSYRLIGEGHLWGLVVLAVVSSVLVLFVNIAPLLRNKIVINDQTISGRINKARFSLRWKDVIAVWGWMALEQPYLIIGARDRELAIPLDLFDEKLLRELIRPQVTPEALKKGAIKRMPGYQFRADESFRVGARVFELLGWACWLLFLLMGMSSLLAGHEKTALLGMALAVPGVLMVLGSGSVEMNKDSITKSTAIGDSRIAWDEVTEIEIGLDGARLVFIGRNKRLVALGPVFWSGEDTGQMLRLFAAQVETRDIDVKRTRKVIWRRNKNTKIKSKSQ